MAKRIEIKEEYMELLDTLDDSERLAFYDALFAYARRGEEIELSGAAGAALFLAKRDIDRQRMIAEKRAANRKKCKEIEKNTNKHEQTQTNTNKHEQTGTNTNKREKEGFPPCPPSPSPASPSLSPYNPPSEEKESFCAPERRANTTRPTMDEVKAYCRERNNRVDAERFVDFYTSNGWKVGKNPMKDWKAAVRTWERDSGGRARAAPREINPFLRDEPEPVQINPFLR